MKFKGANRRLKPLGLVYIALGVAGSLAILRLTLRLLAADELGPVGRWLAGWGGLAAAPFRLVVNAVIGQQPGSTLEFSSLAAGAGYLLLAGLVAALAALLKKDR